MAWVVLALALPLLAAGAWIVWRRPLLALYAFVVGLAFHNAVFLLLWIAGARGWQLTVAGSWKEILLAVAVSSVAWRAARERRLPPRPSPLDLAVVAFAAVALVYFALPQGLLGGSAGLRARAYGLRELLLPVAAYVLGRALSIGPGEFRRLARVVLATTAAVAVVGIVEDYAVPLSVWRSADAAGYFRDQLHFPRFHGPAGLPENFVLNTTDGVFRRLVSTYLSPLGAAYMLAIVLIVPVAVWSRARRRLLLGGCAALSLAALVLTFDRAAVLALAGALVVLALVQRRAIPVAAAALVLAAGVAATVGFASIAPRSHFFPEDRAYQEATARKHGGLPRHGPLSTSDPSFREHLSELERGFRNFAHHPLGYGLGNSGQIGQRFGAESKAGESLYLTVAVSTGALGLAALLALVAAVLGELYLIARRTASSDLRLAAAALLAAQAAVFAIGLQTEVWGDPWLVYVLWAATGAAASAAALAAPAARPGEDAERVRSAPSPEPAGVG